MQVCGGHVSTAVLQAQGCSSEQACGVSPTRPDGNHTRGRGASAAAGSGFATPDCIPRSVDTDAERLMQHVDAAGTRPSTSSSLTWLLVHAVNGVAEFLRHNQQPL
jgi:hypothetical protein